MKHHIRWDNLPLTVYREIEAHLTQIEGVVTQLDSQTSQIFNYNQSQIGGLWISYPDELSSDAEVRVQQILAYYRDRYGSWESLQSS